MAALTKADIAGELTEKLGINKRESKELVESFFEEIAYALEKGDDVKLSGYGNFIRRHKSARPGRNPKTGEEKIISARTVVTFRPGQRLRHRIDNNILEVETKDESSEFENLSEFSSDSE